MSFPAYTRLSISIENKVAFVTMNNPPINLLDAELIRELHDFSEVVEADEHVRVIVFKSADPDFFIAHADVTLFQDYQSALAHQSLKLFQQMTERFQRWPKVTIAQVSGRASGGGSEFLQSLDMRFAAIGKASFSHPEVSLGFIPCKGGTQRLPRLIGRARALEMILGGSFISAEIAEMYGYINRALMPAALPSFVKKLAYKIADFSGEAVMHAKQAVNASTNDLASGLKTEEEHFYQVIGTDACQSRLQAFMDTIAQTKEGELGMGLK